MRWKIGFHLLVSIYFIFHAFLYFDVIIYRSIFQANSSIKCWERDFVISYEICCLFIASLLKLIIVVKLLSITIIIVNNYYKIIIRTNYFIFPDVISLLKTLILRKDTFACFEIVKNDFQENNFLYRKNF